MKYHKPYYVTNLFKQLRYDAYIQVYKGWLFTKLIVGISGYAEPRYRYYVRYTWAWRPNDAVIQGHVMVQQLIDEEFDNPRGSYQVLVDNM